VIRLLHTADVHLGARFLSLGDKGTAQRQQIKAAFQNLVSLAIDEHVDMVLIAGDLFDANQQPQANIDLVVEQFDLLAASNIPVCLIPGTHDCFDSGSIYRKVDFPAKCPTLTLFLDEGWNHREFAALGLTVYARPNLSNRSYNSPLEGLTPSTQSRYHVALAHGAFNIPGHFAEDDYVFTADQIQNSQMQYVALGHWHSPYACSEKGVPAWYSGPPEIISTDQKQPGSVLLVTLPDSGEARVEIRQTGLRSCDQLQIDLSDLENLSQLRQQITEGANPNLIRKVVLKGLRNQDLRPSPDDLEAELSDSFFHLSVDNRSHPRVAELPETAYAEQVILARFVSLVKEHIETCPAEDREIAEDALQYGLALLQGEEVI